MNAVINKIEAILKSEYDIKNYVDLIREIFPQVNIVAPDKLRKEFSNFSSHIEGSVHVGNYIDPDKKKIIIMAVQLKKAGYVDSSRSTQRSFAKKLIENANADAAFIAFYTENDLKWRLSLVRLDYEMKIENGRLKSSENLTPAKRFSYLVGENEPCHTAISRFKRFIIDSNVSPEHPTLDDLENAFSVEKVTDEFFKLYCEKFHQLRENLDTNEDFRIEAEHRNFTSAQFAKKLMGQIVFLYFLQKKGWLGVNAWPDTLNEKEYKNALYARGTKSRELLPLVYRPTQDGIYKISNVGLSNINDDDEAVLATCVKGKPWGSGPHNFMRKLYDLAEKRGKNFFDDYLEPLFYDALNVNRGEQGYCPALHCRIPFLSGGLFEPIDGYDWKYNNFAIPNEVFSNATTKGREADGILDIFDRYNFTMCEDEPMEREVAIDPEMLGKVFENLLEVKDRKSKGAFYTPREIVHYMCQESLINYLTTNLGIEENAIREFILYGDLMKDEDTVKNKVLGNSSMLISESLFKLDNDGKVIVNRLVDVDEALKNVRIADPAVGSGAFPLGMLNEIVRARQNISAYLGINMKPYDKRMMLQTERSPWQLKYDTIKNCIFAADIEPSAVDIAQLRLWLSLVIDDEINPNAQSELDGHRNPLPLPNLESNILCGNSLIDEFEGTRLIKESDLFGDATYQMDINHVRYETIIKKLIEKQNELFRCDNTETKKILKREIENIRDVVIMEQFEGCDSNKIKRYLNTKCLASKPYVLWQLDFARVFKEKGGFDIVIGNPPYIKERDGKVVFDVVNNTVFGKSYHQGKMDYWYYFLHKGIDLIGINGNISYITPRYWLNSTGATKLIKRIKDNLSFISIVDIGKLKVFDNVVGYHMIAQYSKIIRREFVYKKLENSLVDISKTTNTDNVTIQRLINASVITNTNEIVLNERREYSDCVSLGEITDISQGVIEASDKISKKLYKKFPREDAFVGKGIFVISEDEIRNLNLNEYEEKILVPYANGLSVERYKLTMPTDKLIYSDKNTRIKIEVDSKYLTIKNHLDNLSEYITSSNAPYGLHRPRQKYFFENIKIIMPSMFAKNNFAIDYTGRIYVGMSFSVIVVNSEQFLLEYVLAVLNSTIGLKWFFENGKKRGAGVDIGIDKLKSFPIKKCDMEIQENIASKVRQLHENYSIDLDNEVDSIINSLYF